MRVFYKSSIYVQMGERKVTTMTNREKFTEIFGCEIAQHDNGEAIPGHCKILIASDRHFNDWLKQEYVPSAQLAQDLTKGCTDTISREAAIKAMRKAKDKSEAHRMLIQMPSARPGWISVTKQLPENEQEVFVTVEVRPFGQKPFRRVVRAFYTDGKHTDVDSAYFWDEFPDPQYDDDDNMIIPEGWWEASDYSEQQGMIDDFVIAWRERLEPWEGAEDAGEN